MFLSVLLAPNTVVNQLGVLIIDDDISLRSSLARLISRTGARVDVAQDGQEGIEKYHNRTLGTAYALVLTDLKMPRKTGVDVVREIKTIDPQVIVYVLTGKEATVEYRSIREQLDHLSPDGVLQKPIQPKFLMEFIRIISEGGDHASYVREYQRPQS